MQLTARGNTGLTIWSVPVPAPTERVAMRIPVRRRIQTGRLAYHFQSADLATIVDLAVEEQC